ncbi:G-patch domain-containing protein 1 isoform X2 [Physcomitrium patens]|uniref:G-patch domain-containing protein 1 isoform X2 n=1 Tax=Physcomitrium patens TaxID=3218 RepID=UPI000D16894C|nr:G patch domain-containing protein 4-like isoform X2 [Physcomitrium patens]|eukprot:XP_024380716.1 G patch domain-containing protein 4-like isoform X2 [Physcomitrella patens]
MVVGLVLALHPHPHIYARAGAGRTRHTEGGSIGGLLWWLRAIVRGACEARRGRPPAPPALYQGVLKDSKAFRLMTRMGWEEGSGLGKERQGITSHIRVKVRKDNSGVGTDDAKKAAANWTLHTVRVMNYDNILKNLKVQMTEPEVKEDSRDEASSDEDSSDDDSVDDVPSVQEEREIAAAAPAQAPTVIVEMERTVVESKEELMFVEMECEESVSLQEPAADWWGTKYGFVRGGALGSKVRQTVNGERQCQNGRTVFSEQDQENLYNLVNEKATSGKKGLGQDQRALKIGGVKISTRPGQKKVFANAEASDEDEVQGSVISDSQESEPVIEKKLAKRRKRDETSGFKAVLQEGSKIKLKELVAQFLAEVRTFLCAAEQKTSLKKLQRRVTASTGLFSSKDDAVRFRDKMLKSSKFVVEGNTISLKSRPQRYLLTR